MGVATTNGPEPTSPTDATVAVYDHTAEHEKKAMKFEGELQSVLDKTGGIAGAISIFQKQEAAAEVFRNEVREAFKLILRNQGILNKKLEDIIVRIIAK